MRLLGPIGHHADISADVQQLMAVGATSPEIMMNALDLVEENGSTFASFLNRTGATMQGLYTSTDTFKVMGNRQVKWLLKGSPMRKGRIVNNAGIGVTPGVGNSQFTVIVDTNFFGINDDLWLSDNRTTVHVRDRRNAGSGRWAYDLVINTPSAATFVDPNLLAVGAELSFLHTSFPTFSEDASEKTTYDEWHTNYCGIQRAKTTISGSARHTRVLIEHNGTRLWETRQNLEMIQRWGHMVENQMLWARSTMDENGRCGVQDNQGRDIVMGDGVVAQGDASLKYTYNQLSSRTLELVLRDLDLMSTGHANIDIAAICGINFYMDFQRLMTDVFRESPHVLYVGGSGDKGSGVRSNFSFYEIGGLRLHLFRNKRMDGNFHANSYDVLGNSNLSSSAFFVSLGNTTGANANIVPFTLGNEQGDRRYVRRVVNGMTGSGAKAGGDILASSPVDGAQTHILSEIGVLVRNPFGIAELRKARV